jgi:CubicO group peptidase (beta-lactamase class C family)
MKWSLKGWTAHAALLLVGLSSPFAGAQTSRDRPAAGYAAQADALVQDYVRTELFTGTVLVARGGKPLFRKGFGAANREWAIANTPATRFRIGSVTKQFTAAAIMRLVDERKLQLDDAVGKHVRALPPAWQKVTLRQLLQHTSGIPRYTMLDDFDNRLSRIMHTPRQLIDLVKDQPLDFEPGTKFDYNNTGYVLLGCVIEAVSGMAYRDYLEQKLLAPLGLTHSGYDDGRRILDKTAQSYTDGPDGIHRAGLADISNAYAAGAMVSNVDDLLAWQQMLENGKVLSPDSTAAVFTDGGHHYGLGWNIQDRLSRKVHEHGGSWNGYESVLAYYPADKLTVIVLGNYGDQGAVDMIADELARLALGLPPAHREAKVDPRVFSRLVGRYQLAPDMIFSVTSKDGHLFAQLSGQKQLQIYPEDANRYFIKAVDAQLVFDEHDADRAAYLVLHQNGEQVKAPRID